MLQCFQLHIEWIESYTLLFFLLIHLAFLNMGSNIWVRNQCQRGGIAQPCPVLQIFMICLFSFPIICKIEVSFSSLSMLFISKPTVNLLLSTLVTRPLQRGTISCWVGFNFMDLHAAIKICGKPWGFWGLCHVWNRMQFIIPFQAFRPPKMCKCVRGKTRMNIKRWLCLLNGFSQCWVIDVGYGFDPWLKGKQSHFPCSISMFACLYAVSVIRRVHSSLLKCVDILNSNLLFPKNVYI